MFQAEFPKLAAEAMVHAMEISIVKGDGNGQMLGIINDNRVPTANVITLSAEEFTAWTSWCKKIFGSMKKAYRTGTFTLSRLYIVATVPSAFPISSQRVLMYVPFEQETSITKSVSFTLSIRVFS